MKIAIPTNDRKTIAKRTGRATEFAIYHIKNNEIQEVAFIKNTHSHDDHRSDEGNHKKQGGEHGKGQGGGGHKRNHDHNHNHEHGEHNHDELLTLFEKVDILLVRAVGKYMRKTLQKGNVNYQLVKIDDISEILESYLENLS